MIDDFNLLLLSGGFYRCDATWSRPANGIDRCYKVYCPVSGEAHLEMNDARYTLTPRRIYFISGFRLKQQVCPRQMSVYWAHFVPESLYLRYLLDQLPSVCSWTRRNAAVSYREICAIFERPYAEQNRPRADSAPSLDCRIQALLLGLIARLLEKMDQDRMRAFQPEYYRLKGAFDFMQSHFRENPSLATIAGQVGLAPNYFHRRFHSLFGTTPFNFMLAQRLNQARRLLASTDLSIKEVASAVGYDDPPYFTRVFTRQLQMSPTTYRARHGTRRAMHAATARLTSGCTDQGL
jgi:AraC-like DNA-binding protein